MRLRIPKEILDQWLEALERADGTEIGGVLFGEQVDIGDFRILDAAPQRFWRGTATSFRRHGGSARRKILTLHQKIGGNPLLYNYLGEWHSHPNAPAWPSIQDEITMNNLLSEQGEAVNFLVLVIVKLDVQASIQIGARTYLASGHKLACNIVIEDTNTNSESNILCNEKDME
ncbi:Mov34/MPN/PAD-1 family protein [Methylophaga frappieri]|uniref:Mov34/MPN/PAD-1 family protein n=1 Tax=Methylophaga frappieri (strain ATCC BAA-2434 / DSM 25690 / JAM7) TaxID=754477 RepID=UPI000681F376|nr:Mov34/MPN/PAD-1 family protein [Methylophaga frappieri]